MSDELFFETVSFDTIKKTGPKITINAEPTRTGVKIMVTGDKLTIQDKESWKRVFSRPIKKFYKSFE